MELGVMMEIPKYIIGSVKFPESLRQRSSFEDNDIDNLTQRSSLALIGS
jgi:hypothetical protein